MNIIDKYMPVWKDYVIPDTPVKVQKAGDLFRVQVNSWGQPDWGPDGNQTTIVEISELLTMFPEIDDSFEKNLKKEIGWYEMGSQINTTVFGSTEHVDFVAILSHTGRIKVSYNDPQRPSLYMEYEDFVSEYGELAPCPECGVLCTKETVLSETCDLHWENKRRRIAQEINKQEQENNRPALNDLKGQRIQHEIYKKAGEAKVAKLQAEFRVAHAMVCGEVIKDEKRLTRVIFELLCSS